MANLQCLAKDLFIKKPITNTNNPFQDEYDLKYFFILLLYDISIGLIVYSGFNHFDKVYKEVLLFLGVVRTKLYVLMPELFWQSLLSY